MATAKKASFRSFRIFRLAQRQIKLGLELFCNILKKKGCCRDIMAPEVRQAAAVRPVRTEESPGPIEQDAG